MEISKNVSLLPFTYYKIGGNADFFAQPESLDDLKIIAEFIKKNDLSYFILGAGSNIPFNDDGFRGLVIQTSKLDRTLNQTEGTLETGASLMVIHVLRHCMQQGITGLECLVGIPGSMGGVFCMNAGTKSGEIKDVVFEINTFDLESFTSRTLSQDKLSFSYRENHFLKPNEIILSGKIRTKKSEPKQVQDQIQALLTDRKKSQPIDKPSCGSVFKNPDPKNKVFAWKVIDEIGMRGYRIGNAQVSELHTNFIVNLGGAKAQDVKQIIDEAKQRAKDKLGITLEEEVKIIPVELPNKRLK